jgi:acetate---CoA ligase (ADP-forming)
MKAYGIPVAAWRLVGNAAEVGPAAAELGYPVVLKAVGRELVHKSELGAVVVDLRRAEELEEALAAMRARLDAAGVTPDGFLVQELRRGGQEVILGLSRDARFGPLLLFGTGGKYAEVLDDVQVGLAPLCAADAARLVRGIRTFPLLAGVRGDAPADLAALEEVLLRLAQLASRHPRIAELDLNPFLAAPAGGRPAALDVRVRVS